jgi:hypothetical protein
MKSIGIIFLYLFISLSSFSQQGGWEKFIHENGSNSAYDIKPTSDGGYIMTGFSNPTQTLFGHDIMLMKVTGEGEFEWSMNFDAADGSDYGQRVIETYDGGFAVVGRASSPPIFGGDGFFILTDSNGNLVNQGFFGEQVDGDWLFGVVQTPVDSSFILVGTSGNPPFLVRSDKHGDTLFTKRYDDLVGVFQAVTCSEDGEFLYLAGKSSTPETGLLLKCNLLGETIWSTLYPVGADDYSDVLLINDFVVVVGRTIEASQGGYANSMIRFFHEQNGNHDSFKIFERGRFEGIVESNGGDLVVVGRKVIFNGTSFDERIHIVKTDTDGEKIWESEFGENFPVSNLGWGICKGHDYGYVVCGQKVENGIPYVYVIKIDENGSVVSTNSLPFLPEISLYPNPCSEVLNIQLGTFESEKRITVFNKAGQEVYQLTTLDNEIQINEVGFWPSGVYLVHVEVEGHKVVRKVVVE